MRGTRPLPPIAQLGLGHLPPKRIGLLGGSFNPAHPGHRHLSLEALKRLGLDEVWWLVAPQNPLKPQRGMAPFEERLAGAAAVARHPRIRVLDLEARLGKRFTADTLAALRRLMPRVTFIWLMGADNLTQIPRWQRWTEIFRTAPIAVFARPAYCHKALAGLAAQRFRRHRRPLTAMRHLRETVPPAWVFVPMRLDASSATALRSRATRPSARRRGNPKPR